MSMRESQVLVTPHSLAHIDVYPLRRRSSQANTGHFDTEYSMATVIPTVKVEGDNNVKMEDASSPSAASDQFMDDADDDPELDLSDARKDLWLSKLPTFLWSALDEAKDDTEIELGTIRVEGSLDNPERVSLLLNSAPKFTTIEKEYVLRKQTGPARRSKGPGQVMLFSEKNKPGYKQRQSMWDVIDEDGNPGQGRSQLFEQGVRDEKKKANKGKYVPYQKRPIPKITALAGTFMQEFEAHPVDNAEHRKLDSDRTMNVFREKERASISIVNEVNLNRHLGSAISAAERQQINRVSVSALNEELTNRTSQRNKRGQPLRTIEQQEPAKKQFVQIFYRGSGSTNIGACEICDLLSGSRSNGLRRTWKRWRSCIDRVISTANGSLSQIFLWTMRH